MPCRGEAKAPGGIEFTVWIGNDVDLPLAAYFGDPLVGVRLGGVRDGNAVDLGVVVGEFGEKAKGLLGDLWL